MILNKIIYDEFMAAVVTDRDFFEIVNKSITREMFAAPTELEDDYFYYWDMIEIIRAFYKMHSNTLPTQQILSELIKSEKADVFEARGIDPATLCSRLFSIPFNKTYLLNQYKDLISKSLTSLFFTEFQGVYNKTLEGKMSYTESLERLTKIVDTVKEQQLWYCAPESVSAVSEDAYVHEKLTIIDEAVPTGFRLLDHSINGGLRKEGDLGLWVAPTGKGKTAVMTAVANNCRWLGYNVLYITLETVKSDITTRLRAMETGITVDDLIRYPGRYEKEFKDAYKYIRRVTDANIYIEDLSKTGSKFGTAALKEVLSRYKKNHNVDIAFLDYADYMDLSEFDNNIGEWSKLIKLYTKIREISMEVGVPIWTASQVDGIGYETPIIKLGNLQGSKGKANAVEKIITINRNSFERNVPSEYNPVFVTNGTEFEDKSISNSDIMAEDIDRETNNIYEHFRLFVAKCRGAVDSTLVKIEADFSRMMFREIGIDNLHGYVALYNQRMNQLTENETNPRAILREAPTRNRRLSS